jgi:signal transduction histidine kinase
MSGLRADAGRLLAEPLPARTRDIAALAVAALAFLVGAIAFQRGYVDAGISLAFGEDGRVEIASFDPWSPRAYPSLVNQVVTRLNDVPLVALPGEPAEQPPVAGEALDALLREPTRSLEFVERGELDLYLLAPTAEGLGTNYLETWSYALEQSDIAIILGLAILLIGGWWLGSGRGGPTLRPLAIPIVVATATPLLLAPALLSASAVAIVIVAVLWPLATLPLADGLSGLVGDPARRARLRLEVIAAAIVSAIAGTSVLLFGPEVLLVLGQWVAVGLMAFVPGLVAGRPEGTLTGWTTPSGRLVEGMELVAVGATPFIAGFALVPRDDPPFVLPLLLWFVILLIGQRFTVRPLARVATRATLQRDLVVAATEAERARIAADLHDETLQDLTLLVRQLEARGDTEGAAAGRRIAERVRTLTGELRLPILDDLGVGPALEWLVSRMDRMAGGEVRLEREDGTRLPPDIELAFFRVAQEALANAVKHGRPPILVRYRSAPSGASLTIDDAGPGIPPDAADAAPAAGHFGLLGMQQRAEQIGALLDVRRWPTGGTHVALEWRAR